MRRWLIGPVLCTAMLGCAPSALKEQYAGFSGCPEEKIDVNDMGTFASDVTTKYRVSGCGNGVTYYCREGECISPEITIRMRHYKDYGCRVREVEVEYLGGGAWKGSGCGRSLTYQCLESRDLVLRCIAETARETGKRFEE